MTVTSRGRPLVPFGEASSHGHYQCHQKCSLPSNGALPLADSTSFHATCRSSPSFSIIMNVKKTIIAVFIVIVLALPNVSCKFFFNFEKDLMIQYFLLLGSIEKPTYLLFANRKDIRLVNAENPSINASIFHNH